MSAIETFTVDESGNIWVLPAGGGAMTRTGGAAAAEYITVSATGLAKGGPANNGAMFGPDTPGTTTQGLQEAVTYAMAQVAGISGLVAPPTIFLLPGIWNITSTISIPAPAGTGTNSVGFEVAGSGHFASIVKISAGQGFLFGQYAWQDVVFRNLCIQQVTGSSPTSLITVQGTGTTFPSAQSLMMFTNVWFEMPADSTTLPSNGAIYFGPFNGQTGGFILDFTNSVIAGSFSVTSPFAASYDNCLVCSGSSVKYITSSPLTTFGPGSWVIGSVSLTSTGQTVKASGVQWDNWDTAFVRSSSTTNITCLNIRDSFLVFQASSTAALLSQTAGATEIHFDGNDISVGGSNLYTLVTGGCYITNSSTFGSNYPLGYYGGVGNFIQGTSISPNPPVSGTIYQSPFITAVDMAVPVTYSPTSGAAATCVLNIGPQNGFSGAISTETYPANSTTGITSTLRFRVPAGWYYRLTVTNATIGTATVVPEH